MISKKYETVVGLFVVASLAALLFMVLIIAQQEGLWQNYIEYKAVFKNISGLKRGSEVRLAGVTVGTVKSATVRSDGKILVTFEILEKYKDQIRLDTQATIGMIGLLGDRSLDLTPGSSKEALVPPGGLVVAVEPLDLQELLARAGPSLENAQKFMANLVTITDNLAKPQGDFNQAIANIKETFQAISQGKGTLGKLVNDPVLYKEATQTIAGVRKVTDSLSDPKGALGTMLHDPAFKAELQQTLKDINDLAANLRKGSVPVAEAAARLPDIVKRVEAFVVNLDKAGVGLPDLVITGQGALSDADKVAVAAQKLWLLRRYVPKAKEHTIRVEREIR